MDSGDIIDIFLQPGEFFVGDASFRIRTLLGSCVSMTLWHPGLKIGAMSHFLLPTRNTPGDPDGRYCDEALGLMVAQLADYGARASACQAKLFGGGNMFPNRARSGPAIGVQNGEAARQLLAAHGIPLVASSLFGVGHRQIMFEVASGDVWSRQSDVSMPARTAA
jgi:chemotaxis protein CheD